MTNVLRKRAGSWNKAAKTGEKEAPAITNECVASLRVVDAHTQGPAQPGAEFLRTAVRGIPCVVRYRRSTVVRPVPP